jgi:iron complex outermembrane recepter protein
LDSYNAWQKNQNKTNFCYGFAFLVSYLGDKAAMKEWTSSLLSRQIVGEMQHRTNRALGLLVIWSSLVVGSSVCVAGDPSDEQLYDIDIPSLNAAEALNHLAEQTGAIMLFPYDLAETRQANAVNGRFTLMDALGKLLKNTGLSSGLSDKRVIRIALDESADHNYKEGKMATAKVSFRRKIGMFISSVFVASGAGAQGQQQSGSDELVLEEIVVTSQRREQSLRDVPISITAFTGESIRNNMIDDITGYFNKTPNVSFMEGGTRSSRSISIRGVSDVGGLTSSFAVYVDEFNVANGPTRANDNNINSSLNPQLQDVERIEVLRGPQGTFYGRNASGGAINIITKKPEADFYAEGTLEYGRFNTWNLGGVVNGTVIEDKMFVRASAYYATSDSFVKNVAPAGGNSGYDYSNFRLSARFLPSDNVTIDLTLSTAMEDQGIDASVPSGVLEKSSVGLATSLGIVNQPVLGGTGAYPFNTRLVSQNTAGQQTNDFTVATGKFEYVAENFTITSVTGYLDSKHQSTIDLDLTNDDYFNQDSTIETDSISEELRIQSSGDGDFDWIFGGLYAVDNLSQYFLARVGAGGLFFGLPENLPLADGQIDTRRTSYAFFGEATWHANDRLALTFGARYSNDTVRRIENRLSFFTQLPEAAGQKSFDDFSPKFSLTYSATDDVTLYATASRGYKAGGLQTNIENPAFAVTSFDDETMWNYEGGIKADLMDNRLYLGLSAFYMDWSDVQVLSGLTLIDPDTGLPTFLLSTDNATSAISKGLEFEFRALLTEGLQIGGGIGYLNAKFESFSDALIFGETFDLSGTPLPRAPKWTANADAQYNFEVQNGMDAFVRGEFSFRTEAIPLYDATVREGYPWRTPTFGIYNLRAGLVTEKYQVTAYVENLTDKQYFTGIDPTFGFSGVMIRPSFRVWGIRFRMNTN